MEQKKSQGQLILERIKDGPPLRLHRIEELDLLLGYYSIKRKIIECIVKHNLKCLPVSYRNLNNEIKVSQRTLRNKIKEVMGLVDTDHCLCFNVTIPEIKEVYGYNSLPLEVKRTFGDALHSHSKNFRAPCYTRYFFALFAKNEEPVYRLTFPGENYEIVSLMTK